MFSKIITLFCIIAFARGTEVNDCLTSTAPQPIFVEIEGCIQQPCPLVRGQDAIMIMNFTSPVPITTLKANVLAQPEGTTAWVPFPMGGNVCDDLINTHCPLEENEPAVYRMVMRVSRAYPEINLLLQFSIKPNGGTEDLVCFAVYGNVVSKS